MRVALVYPPLADATQPYSSLPSLAAFLRMRGNHAVSVHDANIDFCLSIWTRRRLDVAGRRIGERLAKLEQKPELSGPEAEQYLALMAASLKVPHVAVRIEQAVSDLRRWETFASFDRLAGAKRVLQDANEILGAESLLLRRRISSFTPAVVARLTRNHYGNPFTVFFEKVTIPQLVRIAPAAIGVSITYPTQIVPAVALAGAIRRHIPFTPVIFGGQIVSAWYDDLESHPEVFEWCDYVVGFEGENALEGLLTAIENGSGVDHIANVAWREGSTVRRAPILTEDINALPTPDYSDLPLERYVAPEPVLLLNTSRGCYWSRCTFCSVSPSMRSQFRMRDTKLVLRDLAALQNRYSTHCITLGDDCVPPATLQALARGLADAGLSWQCEVRLERALSRSLLKQLAAAGCRNLIFGLESYSERILARMKKGIRPPQIEDILEHCREAGVAVNLQLFFGFPGETEREAQETLEFVSRQLHGAVTLSFGQFRLQHGSAIARAPATFGIRINADSAVLGTDMPYEPTPLHAPVVEKQLAERVRAKARARNLPLGIDAHTLLYLHKSGVDAMGKNYYAAHVNSSAARQESAPGRLKRRSSQSLRYLRDWQNGNSRYLVLYDYELDSMVEISRLAGWVLAELDEYASIDEIVSRAAAQARSSIPEVTPAVTSAISALEQAGVLERQPKGTI